MIFTRTESPATPAPHATPTLRATGPDAGIDCALTETRVTAQVAGFIAEVKVEQVYQNPLDRPLHTQYTFPLPHDAAVCGFRFTVAGQVIEGAVAERTTARQAFEAARDQGQRAALVEQQRANVFTLELAHVPPRAEVRAEVTYLEALPYRSGAFTLRVPAVVAPRYAAPHTPPLPEKHEPGRAHRFFFAATIDAGMPIEAWSCGTHLVDVRTTGATGIAVALSAGQDRANRDVVFEYRVGGAGVRVGVVTHRPDPAQDGTFYMYAVPPADVATGDVRGKEVTFLLDRSGSMEGPKMTQAREALRACLRALNPQDAFNVVAFNATYHGFAPAPVPFAQSQLERAEAWLAQLSPDGGTEVLAPLAAALAAPADPRRQRVVVLITDGQVSDADRVLALVRHPAGGARLYTVGVDSAVNAHLLRKLAQLGKGAAELVLPTGDIEGRVTALCQRFAAPLLTDPIADFGTLRVTDLTPLPLPDVMAGEPIVIAGRYRGQGPQRVGITGQGQSPLTEIAVDVDFPAECRAHPVVDRIWARLMIDRHEDTLLDDPHSATMKRRILEIALRHGLVSSQTSLLAVDSRDADPARAREAVTHQVPQELPAGWGHGHDAGTFAGLGSLGGGMDMLFADVDAPLCDQDVAPLEACASGPLFCLMNEEVAPPPPPAPRAHRPPAAAPAPKAALDPLRELAKRQRADGSWDGTVEDTAAALAAFIAAGHTDRTGAYTAQLRRAIEWIDQELSAGYAGPVTRLHATLAALVAATGSAQHRALHARALA